MPRHDKLGKSRGARRSQPRAQRRSSKRRSGLETGDVNYLRRIQNELHAETSGTQSHAGGAVVQRPIVDIELPEPEQEAEHDSSK